MTAPVRCCQWCPSAAAFVKSCWFAGPTTATGPCLEVLREQHPDLAGLTIREVAGGWGNQMWRLGDLNHEAFSDRVSLVLTNDLGDGGGSAGGDLVSGVREFVQRGPWKHL